MGRLRRRPPSHRGGFPRDPLRETTEGCWEARPGGRLAGLERHKQQGRQKRALLQLQDPRDGQWLFGMAAAPLSPRPVHGFGPGAGRAIGAVLPSRDIGLAEHGKQGGFGVLKVLALGVLVEHNLPEVFDGRGGFHW